MKTFKLTLLITSFVTLSDLYAIEVQLPLKIPTSSEINAQLSPKEPDCLEIENNQVIKIPKERLKECYQKFPSLMNVLYLVSDADFIDESKKQERKQNQLKEMNTDSNNFKNCSKDIHQYSQENNDPKNHVYIEMRLSEIFNLLK